MLSLNLWHEGILAPIDVANPVGTDIRLSELFDLLQQEVSNDLAMDREATDWHKVLTLSSDVLAKQSKDILVLVYSIRAVISVYQYEGLARSIALLVLYIDLYWVQGFPLLKKRKRARLSALEWLTQSLAVWLEANEPSVDDKAHIESVISGLILLNNKLAKQGDEWVLDTFSITKKLNAFLRSMPNHKEASADAECLKNITAPPISEPLISVSQPIAINSQSSQLDVIDEKSFNIGVRSAQAHLKSLAAYCLSQDLQDPLAYEISRFSTWLPILELPHHKDKITPLRPVPLDKQQAFALHYQQKRYETLIPEVESSLISSPFWLDGHRIVVESLSAMDSDDSKPHQKAINQISQQVKGFVTRLEGIEQLRFFDGTPFADENTVKWLASLEVKDNSILDEDLEELDIAFSSASDNAEAGTFDVETGTSDSEQVGAEKQIVEKAQALLRDKRFSDGLSILAFYCNSLLSRSKWFRGRMLMAQYCMLAKEYSMAEQLLLELDEISICHKLDHWEPEKVIELLSIMLICKKKLNRKQEVKDYFNRLSRLDIMHAYVIKKGE